MTKLMKNAKGTKNIGTNVQCPYMTKHQAQRFEIIFFRALAGVGRGGGG